MVSYIMKSIAYSGFLRAALAVWLSSCKNTVERAIKHILLGTYDHERAYAHLFLVSGCQQKILANSLELLVQNGAKSTTLVIVWPGFEPAMGRKLHHHHFDHVVVVNPPHPSSIGPMMAGVSSVFGEMALLVVNVGAWALAEDDSYGADAVDIYGKVQHYAATRGCALVVVEDLDGLSKRNSAFLRRLFPRNTLI